MDCTEIYQEWTKSLEFMLKKSKILKASSSEIIDEEDEWSTSPVVSNVEEFKLPKVESFFTEPVWEIDVLLDLRDKLNKVKTRLDKLELSSWHKHTRTMNPSNQILRLMKEQYEAEYCTQAWGKLMEIISTNPIIPETVLAAHNEGVEIKLNSVHLCEAPGAFISAANHFIKTKCFGLNWDWIGTTLNPYHESNEVSQMINEDKLMLTSSDKWTFLKDNTGNIINRGNIKSLGAKINEKKLVPVHFVTADGSIDCQDSPCEQESVVIQLQFAEIISALMILGEGGSFVIKIFTFLEATTICHLYLLACAFKEIRVVKPATSKEGNSEVYIVCLKYLGRFHFDKELKVLFSHVEKCYLKTFKDNPKCLFSLESIPKVFIEKIIEAAEFFVGLQISTIQRNLASFKKFKIYSLIRESQRHLANNWVSLCRLQKLPKSAQLSPDYKLTTSSLPHVDPREEIGSFSQRLENSTLTLGNLKILRDKLRKYQEAVAVPRMSRKINVEPAQLALYKIDKVKVGKAFTNIRGSRFCSGKLLLLRQEFRELVKKNFTPEVDVQVEGTVDGEAGEIHCTEELNKAKLHPLITKYQGENPGPWTLSSICYKETLEDLALKTDAHLTQEGLMAFLEALIKLEVGGNLFLCEYPLLTRLQVGIILALVDRFTTITLCYNEAKDITGILLYNFKGFDPETELLTNLECIVESLEESSPCQTVLECLEMPTILSCGHHEFFFQYNIINITRRVMVNVQRLSMLKNGHNLNSP